MSDVTCSITGLDELEQKLEQLAPKQAKTALRRAARQSAEIFEEEVEARAPRLTGMLAESFVIRSRASASEEDGITGAITASVKVDAKAKREVQGITRPYKYPFKWAHLEARFAEFGTVHEAARPFIGPAFEAKSEDALETFVTALVEELQKLESNG